MAGGDYYSRVSARFWIDTKTWGERNQRVALYLLTNTHSTMEGLYHLPLGYLCADLGLTPKQAQAALAFIESQGVVAYDQAAEVVFICKALKHGAPKNKNHVTGAVNRLKSVPSSPLWDDFRMACERHSKALADAIRTSLPTTSELSISSSRSIPPKGPQGGNDTTAPLKPSGGRARDLAAYEQAMSDWAAQHFPDAQSVDAVIGAVGWMSPRCDGHVTAQALRDLAASSDTWAGPLGLSSKEAAA